ncbi:MAG TPA: hypothetical protein VKQ32_03595, partial [Polyangia bacterium]|nr:hypothetical protein [Polyangia bacterium]
MRIGRNGMASGPDGDGDDDELVDIELEELPGEAEAPAPPRAPPPSPPALTSRPPPAASRPAPPVEPAPAVSEPPAEGEVELGDLVEVRQPIAEAAESDAHADRTLFESEAAAADQAPRRAGLLLEVSRLLEAEGEREGALAAARTAFAAAPALAITLWTLRRLLSGAELWGELADAYGAAADAIVATPGAEARAARARADLLVERGRLLEDRLQRDADAIASYEAARTAEPDHIGALLALLLAG